MNRIATPADIEERISTLEQRLEELDSVVRDYLHEMEKVSRMARKGLVYGWE